MGFSSRLIALAFHTLNYSFLICPSVYFKYLLHSNLRIQAIPSALGVSAAKQYHVNSLAVPRKAKEAIGGITGLTHSDGKWIVSSLIDIEGSADSGGACVILIWDYG